MTCKSGQYLFMFLRVILNWLLVKVVLVSLRSFSFSSEKDYLLGQQMFTNVK